MHPLCGALRHSALVAYRQMFILFAGELLTPTRPRSNVNCFDTTPGIKIIPNYSLRSVSLILKIIIILLYHNNVL